MLRVDVVFSNVALGVVIMFCAIVAIVLEVVDIVVDLADKGEFSPSV